ncbi:hypothetical protein Egran_03717 [Elaphomyces granulatus]|uniref:PPM-type phosphatase domain-containing protein n=1 Tax=Elaphomyces granulatus TaxID=519963 RepID=A0A232LWG0_9EURO|nr:hypothetical protein Egran_03717 [Elaphomyces granulatus]
MFGGSSSSPKEKADALPVTIIGPARPFTLETEDVNAVREKKTSPSAIGPFHRRHHDDPASKSEKKRRSSSVAKAASFFSSAKNTFHFSSSRDSGNNTSQSTQTSFHMLGKMDSALSLPQGSHNNSAGESLPTLRSSFRVGVTEDRNRKCRRTMEDTHAYLYNFLGTPAPVPGPESSSANSRASSTIERTDSMTEPGGSGSVIETDNGYFAIFDGHAGTFAAEWCGKKLHLILEDIMKKNPNTPVPELLDQAFTSVDQQLEKLPVKNSGCTVVAAVLRWEDRIPSSPGSIALVPAVPATASESEAVPEHAQTPTQPEQNATPAEPAAGESPSPTKEAATRLRVLYTANVGDARIVLCRNGKALRLSYDHKGSDENEGKRIANAGGLILNNRVNGILAVTRALGDTYMKDLVTGHPYTTETVIQPDQDEFLILACDGLWDVCTDQEAVDLIRDTKDAQEASKILVDHALSRFSTDNLSCMVVRFDSDLTKGVVEQRSESLGVEGDLSAKKDGVNEADEISEGTKQSLESSGGADEAPSLSEKPKDEILGQASVESPSLQLSVVDNGKVTGSDVSENPKTTTGKK